jgi:hypothetical protein
MQQAAGYAPAQPAEAGYAPAQPAAAEAAPEQAAAGGYPPEQAASGGYTPGQAAPGGYPAGQGAPGGYSPGQATPVGYSPGQAAPGGYAPGQQAAAGFIPAQQAAAGAAPGQAAGGFSPVSPLPADTAPVPPFPAGLAPVPGMAAPAPPRRRRRWVAAVVAAAAVVVLLIGLVIWAPWKSPPLLRPTGLAAGALTVDSVAFHWSDPPTGPLPDKYLILHNGTVIGTVPGSVTTYQANGLAPDTPYQYRIVAERGGKRSAMSVLLVVRTAVPPVSAARWQGPWTVTGKITRGASTIHGAKKWTDTWEATPGCAAGPCTVRLAVSLNGHNFKVTMARAGSGAVYRGRTHAHVFPCGLGSTSFPIKSSLAIRIKLSGANVDNGAWLATGWTGTMAVASPYTASGNYYCPAAHQTISLSGGP